jgi:hypothetical protein
MPGNKRMPRSRARSARDLANEGKAAPSRRLTAQERARQLANEVHRLEVEIVATQRMAREHRARNVNTLPAPERQSGPRSFALTHSQKRSRRYRFYLQSAQFLITACLVAGAGAWLYKLWQSVQ